jgi:DNA-binding Lrp family transcriptional regulator
MLTWIDMYHKDEEIFQFIEEHQNERLPHSRIADALGIHRLTVRVAIQRLEGAGKIIIYRCGTRGGFVYQCIEN